MRANRKVLEASVDALNMSINKEQTIWYVDFLENPEGELKSRKGMFKLDISNGGYQLTKIVNDGGGESDLSPRMTAGEMHKFLTGLFLGIQLQTEKEGVV
tara:strand:- start:179 stop:478 length:300 start_codon:yes stop_codon:yes gene_type:complete